MLPLLWIRFGLRWPAVGAVVAALLALGSPSALQARADCAPPVPPPAPFHVYGSFVEGGLNLYWSYDWLKVDCPATFFRVYRDGELIGKPSAAPSDWVGQDPADPPYTPPIIGMPAIPPKPAAVYVYLDKFENILVTKFESPALFASYSYKVCPARRIMLPTGDGVHWDLWDWEDGCSANVTVSSQVEPVEKPYVDNPATVLSPP